MAKCRQDDATAANRRLKRKREKSSAYVVNNRRLSPASAAIAGDFGALFCIANSLECKSVGFVPGFIASIF